MKLAAKWAGESGVGGFAPAPGRCTLIGSLRAKDLGNPNPSVRMSAAPKTFTATPALNPGTSRDLARGEAAENPVHAAGPGVGDAWGSVDGNHLRTGQGSGTGWNGLLRPEEVAQAETVWCSVGSLAEELGQDSVAELVDDFTVQTPQLLSKLDTMCGIMNEQPALRRAAHSLKGSSSIFGLAGIERFAFQLERTVLENELRAQAGLVLELKRQFARTVPVLKAVRSRLLGEGD